MASDTPMGKQGGEFEPAPGIRGWWIIYADIFLYDGDNRNLNRPGFVGGSNS